MKRLYSLFTIVLLLTIYLTQNAPQFLARAQAASHTLYVVGLSPQTTVTIRNSSANYISVILTPLNASGFQIGDGAQRVDIPAAGSKDLQVAELSPGTITLQMESDTSFEAYAYEGTAGGTRPDFIPALSVGGRVLRFPQLLRGSLQSSRITLFNPAEQPGSVELIALDDSGSELGRAYGGMLLPRQTLELVARDLLLTTSTNDISVIEVTSSVTLIGRQRMVLPRGDTVTLPPYMVSAGVEPQPAPLDSKEGESIKPPINLSASASLDDYPYKTSPFCPSNVSACPKNTIDPYSFFFRECTSFVAWRMNRDAGTIDPRQPSFTNTMKGGRWSNGGNWSANAAKLGYRVDNIPEAGAIAQWKAKECSGCAVGHVAYVESVNADGSVNLSEYNYSVGHGYGYRSKVPVSKVGRFIHISKLVSGAPRPIVSASLRLLTAGSLTVDQRIQITFAVTNRGGKSITFQRLLAGGRRDGDPNCTIGGCPDFPSLKNVTLNPGQSLTYTQTQAFSIAGRYKFFVAYQTSTGWVTSVDADAGVSNSVGVTINPKTLPPTLTGYSWNKTPRANKSFSGTIKGTAFVSGATQVWFCINKTNTCYQHPRAGVAVNKSTRAAVSNVKLSRGSWRIYVRTSAGQSALSTAFTVR